MAAKQNGKRPLAHHHSGSLKRRKVALGSTRSQGLDKHISNTKRKEKGKEKAADRGIIPVPSFDDEDDLELSEHDLEALEEYGSAVSFLNSLDHKAISRSKKETIRLHRLHKPVRQARQGDDLPSVDSHDEDEDSWDSNIEDLSDNQSLDESQADESASSFSNSDASDIEQAYEIKHQSSWEPRKTREVPGLPIKLPDGRIRSTGKVSVIRNTQPDEKDEESDVTTSEVEPQVKRLDDVSTGARFGRVSVVEIVGSESRPKRISRAKEQIAGICQDILADPENSLGLLRRLHTFSLAEISTPAHPQPVLNDPTIRKLALLSQLAVFKDIIPGYRIRPLTDKEKAENVSQMVARTREWEQGLLLVYQTYLRTLEAELKIHGDLAENALKCMCTLLAEVTHFNFRVNLMGCIVARLSKKAWDESSNMCLNTLIHVFRGDLTGTASLEIVRLLNRMIREKKFSVNPEVLSCLLHLRLKTELGVRASEVATDKPQDSRLKGSRRARKKDIVQPHLSKKAKKALREKKEIDKEFREAEAEVDKEERANTQTETLKLLFVLYFRIIKNPHRTPLLPAALYGISKFAHLVNIDFFKDLMAVLKTLIKREHAYEDVDVDVSNMSTSAEDVQNRLLCIITAFELLSGQGDSLNIDLSDFISCLYALILPLSLVTDIDVPLASSLSSHARKPQSTADMLFRALTMVFSPRSFGATAPPGRSAAFAKRLLNASLHWPPAITLRTLDIVGGLIAKDPKLECLLSTEDRNFDGIYRPDIDDPELCHPFGTSFWELHILHRSHWDVKIRDVAGKILSNACP